MNINESDNAQNNSNGSVTLGKHEFINQPSAQDILESQNQSKARDPMLDNYNQSHESSSQELYESKYINSKFKKLAM